jgi:F0F1-type ATP synthase assembly protein I
VLLYRAFDVTKTPRRRYAPKTDDGLAQGMESVGTLVVFMGLGWLVDRWLGTQPVFMIAFVVLAVVGLGAKIYAAYTLRMKDLEQQRLQGRATGSAS